MFQSQCVRARIEIMNLFAVGMAYPGYYIYKQNIKSAVKYAYKYKYVNYVRH